MTYGQSCVDDVDRLRPVPRNDCARVVSERGRHRRMRLQIESGGRSRHLRHAPEQAIAEHRPQGALHRVF